LDRATAAIRRSESQTLVMSALERRDRRPALPEPRTVEWDLRKVFGKLGIHSRHELAEGLAGSESELTIPSN
jgi:hypothetical protein